MSMLLARLMALLFSHRANNTGRAKAVARAAEVMLGVLLVALLSIDSAVTAIQAIGDSLL